MTNAESAYGNAVAQHLEALSNVEAARLYGDSAELQQVTAQVAEQRQRLLALAAELQVPAPWLSNGNLQVTVDAATALAQARNAFQQAEQSIQAARQQLSAPLFPGLAPAVRAGLVYGGWSFVGWLIQCGLLVATNGTKLSALLISFCAMPALVFLAAFLTLHLAGQPRIGPKYSYSWKLGVAICCLGMPSAWILLVATLAMLRG